MAALGPTIEVKGGELSETPKGAKKIQYSNYVFMMNTLTRPITRSDADRGAEELKKAFNKTFLLENFKEFIIFVDKSDAKNKVKQPRVDNEKSFRQNILKIKVRFNFEIGTNWTRGGRLHAHGGVEISHVDSYIRLDYNKIIGEVNKNLIAIGSTLKIRNFRWGIKPMTVKQYMHKFTEFTAGEGFTVDMNTNKRKVEEFTVDNWKTVQKDETRATFSAVDQLSEDLTNLTFNLKEQKVALAKIIT